jgi:hypothetical protein
VTLDAGFGPGDKILIVERTRDGVTELNMWDHRGGIPVYERLAEGSGCECPNYRNALETLQSWWGSGV